jgi:hypothetical protein
MPYGPYRGAVRWHADGFWSKRLVLLGGLLLVGWLYGPVRTAGLVYEDRTDPTPFLQPWQGWRVEGQPWVNPRPRVLTMATFRLQMWAGASVGGLHAGNVAIHLVNAGLVATVLGGWPGVLGALLWAVCPLTVEALAYLEGRTDLLLVMMTLLAIWAGQHRRWDWAVLAVLAGIGAKETGVLVAVAVALWTRPPWWWSVMGVGLGAWLAALLLPRLSTWTDPPPEPWWRWWATQVMVAGRETTLLWRPAAMTVDHRGDLIGAWLAAAVWLGVASLTVGLWWLWETRAGHCVIWMGVVLAPRLVVGLPDPVAERQWMLGALGFWLMATRSEAYGNERVGLSASTAL